MPNHEFDWRKAIAEIKANFGVLGTGIEEIAAGAARDARRDALEEAGARLTLRQLEDIAKIVHYESPIDAVHIARWFDPILTTARRAAKGKP